MIYAIGVLITVCSIAVCSIAVYLILAGWLLDHRFKLDDLENVPPYSAPQVIEVVEEQIQKIQTGDSLPSVLYLTPNLKSWVCWNPPFPVGSIVLYRNWPHLVIETEDQGLRLAAFRLPYSQR